MTNRVVIGDLPGGGVGIRVSRPGFNVLSTSLQGKQLAFDSRWPRTSRILLSGTVTLPAGSSGYNWINFGQTLPYIPFAFVLEYSPVSATWHDSSGGSGVLWSNSHTSGLYRSVVENNRIGLTGYSGFSIKYSYIVLMR